MQCLCITFSAVERVIVKNLKRSIILLAVFLFCLSRIQGQINVEVNAGIPTGEISDIYSMTFGINMYFMFAESQDGLVNFGGTTGYIYYADKFGGGGEFQDASFIPVAGTARIKVFKLINFGPDIGYAVAVDKPDLFEDYSGGFYWKLAAGIDVVKKIELNLFYHNIYAETTFATIGLGGLVKF